MCYICTCFGWILDLLQRALTFCLSCIMSCVICFGLAVVIAAGIAYGYNYMMAEFLTLARSDVFVYIRRGQFYEKADLKGTFRRSGGGGSEGNELFSSNSSDYQDTKPVRDDIKPLPNTWRKAIDRRNYAENLVSFSGNVKNETVDSNMASYNMVADPVRPTLAQTQPQLEATVVLVRGPPTTTPRPLKTSTTQMYPDKITTIVMRKYYPNPHITMAPEATIDDEFYQEPDRPIIDPKPKQRAAELATSWPSQHQHRRKIVKKGKAEVGPRRLRQELKSRASVDYGQEEEEDDQAYKPV